MITVGLAKELYFIAKVLNRELSTMFNGVLMVNVKPDGIMTVEYNGYHIWTERIEGDVAFFGVESCDTISRIIALIDRSEKGDYSWKHLEYHNTE